MTTGHLIDYLWKFKGKTDLKETLEGMGLELTETQLTALYSALEDETDPVKGDAKIKILLDITEDFLQNLFINAFESGMYGVPLWCEELEFSTKTFTAKMKPEGYDKTFDVNLEVMRLGLERMIQAGEASEELLTDIKTGDGGQSDAIDAENVVQFGIFGKAIYG